MQFRIKAGSLLVSGALAAMAGTAGVVHADDDVQVVNVVSTPPTIEQVDVLAFKLPE